MYTAILWLVISPELQYELLTLFNGMDGTVCSLRHGQAQTIGILHIDHT